MRNSNKVHRVLKKLGVKYRPILMIFGVQHQEETCR